MNDLSFLKVTLVPEPAAGSGFMDIEIMVPVTSILAVKKTIGMEYDIVIKEKYFEQIQSYYFGKSGKIKNIKAKIKDEAIFY